MSHDNNTQQIPELGQTVEELEITVRQEFYHDAKAKLIVILLLSLACAIFLGFYVYFLLNKVPEPKYFRTTAANQLIPPEALDKPHFPENVVLFWITDVVSRAYSFNYSNMERIILSIRSHFTSRGFDSYIDALASTGRRQLVLRDKLISSATPTAAPIITREGVVDGRYAWSIKVPMRITYSGVNLRRDEQISIKLLVIRDKTTEESPWGMKIFTLKAESIEKAVGL